MKPRKNVEGKNVKGPKAGKTFIDFILACETKNGGRLFREYMATESSEEMKEFFKKRGYEIESKELENLWTAKKDAKYLSIDYEYINGPGMSY